MPALDDKRLCSCAKRPLPSCARLVLGMQITYESYYAVLYQYTQTKCMLACLWPGSRVRRARDRQAPCRPPLVHDRGWPRRDRRQPRFEPAQHVGGRGGRGSCGIQGGRRGDGGRG